MKQKQILIPLLVIIVLLIFAGCGPKGGTITLVNNSSYQLSNGSISLGESSVKTLNPGQWMKASVDKNVIGATVQFQAIVPTPGYLQLIGIGEDYVVVEGVSGNWGIIKNKWNSSLFGVKDGESIIVTVLNKRSE